MTSMHPLVALFLILIFCAIGALAWALRSIEKRLEEVENRPAGRKTYTAVPIVGAAEDVNGGFSIEEDLEAGRVVRTHIPPAPLGAADHVGAARLDVTI
jgi:hypothetical protein